MPMKQLIRAIKIGIRSRLFICLFVFISAYWFSLIPPSHEKLIVGIIMLVSSETMILLWGTSFSKMLTISFPKKNEISWEETPIVTKLKSIAISEHVTLNKKRPFGIRKNFENAYANPLTGQIVIGDKFIQKYEGGILAALIGHEITHVKRKHYIKMIILTLLIPTLFTLPLKIIGTTQTIYYLAFYAVYFITFLVLSWHNEYEADAGGAKIAGKDNMIELLESLVPENQWHYESETHPCIKNRILKLRKNKKG